MGNRSLGLTNNDSPTNRFLKNLRASGSSSLSKGFATAEGFYAKGSTPNRPQQNHNPGDMEYGPFAMAHGATGSDGRFAIFPDDATGMAALDALLSSKNYKDLSIDQKVSKYLGNDPKDNNNPSAYLKTVLSAIPGASAPLSAVGASAASPASGSVDKSVTVGDVTINTQSSDPKSIAREFQSMDWLLPAQANSGQF